MLWVIYPRLRGCRMQGTIFLSFPFSLVKDLYQKRAQGAKMWVAAFTQSRALSVSHVTGHNQSTLWPFPNARAEVTLSMQHSREKHAVVAPTPNFKESRQQKNLIGFHMHVDPIFPGKLLILLAHKERRLEGRYLWVQGFHNKSGKTAM